MKSSSFFPLSLSYLLSSNSKNFKTVIFVAERKMKVRGTRLVTCRPPPDTSPSVSIRDTRRV